MSIVILIPALLCVIALFYTSPQRVFLNVYLPVLFLLPAYYFWKVASLPPVHFGEAVLFPLLIGILLYDIRRWHFTRSDLWVALFLFSSYQADHLKLKESIAIFELFAAIGTAGIPYIAGKLLIEQYGARFHTLKRIVILLFICSIISAWEYRMGRNPFSMVLVHLFPDESFAWKTQIRWGFGRVAGPFAQSELAGIIFAFGLLIALYLQYFRVWEPRFAHFTWLPFKKATIITSVIAFTLLMTQARGPWLGCLIAIPIAFIGRTKNVLRSSIIVALLGIAIGSVGFVFLKAYTSGPAKTDEQQTAQYRKELITNYTPVVQAGGLYGWGQDFPQVGPQGSIDNEYLYIALTQGYLGLISLVLIAFEALLKMAALGFFGVSSKDRYFGFTLLGITVGILLTIGTVYLGQQPYQLFFLLAGWSQSLVFVMGKARKPQPSFETVYT